MSKSDIRTELKDRFEQPTRVYSPVLEGIIR